MTDLQLTKIVYERRKQDEKWGEQNHTDFKWASILLEEAGEVGHAVLELHPTKEQLEGNWEAELEKELVQTAAVCVAWLEHLERRKIQKEQGGSHE